MGLFRRWAIQLSFIALALLYLGGAFLPLPVNGHQELSSSTFPLVRALSWMGQVFFGTHPLSIRFFPLVIGFTGIISTYKLGFLLYNKRIGFVAAMILSSSALLMHAHIQTQQESLILMGLTTFAVWHMMELVYYHRVRNLVFASCALAGAMYTAGFGALLLPMVAMGTYFIGKGAYGQLAHKRWLYLGGLVLVLMAPYLLVLHQLPDVQSVAACSTAQQTFSATAYFFIESWKEIWAYCPNNNKNAWTHFSWFFGLSAPWSLAIFIAIIWRFSDLFAAQWAKRAQQEWLNPGAFFIPLTLLLLAPNSTPQDFLPIFPFAAIMASEFLLRLLLENTGWKNRLLRWMQMLFVVLLLGATGFFNMQVSGYKSFSWVLFLGVVALVVVHWRNSEEHLDQAVMVPILTGIWLLTFYLITAGLLFG